MNLDDIDTFRRLDRQRVIEQIDRLPESLREGWERGLSLPLPVFEGLQGIVLAGVGAEAVSADLFNVYASPYCAIPLLVHSDYDLPAWVRGPQVLVIAVSHLGDTEETLAAFEQAQSRGCRGLALTTGGKLASIAQAGAASLWLYELPGQPNQAVGYLFGLLLAAFYRAGLIPDPSTEIHETLRELESQRASLRSEIPVAHNPAKRMAGQMVGRIAVIYGADSMAPVARRWKSQINELSKAWGHFEVLPDADHSSPAGLNHPDAALSQVMVLFITARGNHPQNQVRLDFTRQIFMTQGINTDTLQVRGESRMAQIWTALQFGDYSAYYLAMACGEDPKPHEVLAMLEDAMSQTRPS